MILKAQHKSILVLIWHTWVSILGHCSPTKVSGKLKDTCSPKGFRCVGAGGSVCKSSPRALMEEHRERRRPETQS